MRDPNSPYRRSLMHARQPANAPERRSPQLKNPKGASGASISDTLTRLGKVDRPAEKPNPLGFKAASAAVWQVGLLSADSTPPTNPDRSSGRIPTLQTVLSDPSAHRLGRHSLPQASETLLIGVGMAVVGHPSLRTGRADFPHPALQSVSHPLAAGLVRSARAKAYREISP